MRLLRRSRTGEFSLTDNLVGDEAIPPYAILSHTWGADAEEVALLLTGLGEEYVYSTLSVKLRVALTLA